MAVPTIDPIPTILPIQTIGTNLVNVETRITAVGASATWTSGIRSTDGYVRATVLGIFNESGTMYVDQSNDGTNFDYSSSTATTGGTGFAISVEIVAAYVRFRWTNGTANVTTTHRLYCYLRST
jgi:hypothetical protein